MTLIFLILLFLLGGRTPPLHAEIKYTKTNINSFTLTPKYAVTVSARVGGYLFNIQGYTSPWARVEFFSTEGNIQVVTMADKNGKFVFKSVLSPIETGEFCFLSYDIDQKANNPLCFEPPPPSTQTNITGIFLSPTLTLTKGSLKQDEQSEAHGRAFPNTKLKIYLFSENKSIWREILDNIRIYAKEAPSFETETNKEGYFSFNLPTQKSGNWRIFIGPEIKDNNMTAKSNTLKYSSLSWWQWYLVQILTWTLKILKTLFSFLLRVETAIIALIIIILVLGKKIFIGK